MTTVREIVFAAHRKIGVLASGEELDADAASEAVFAFNNMVHGWKAGGVDVEHTDQALSDDFALPAEFVEGAVYLLAQRLSPDFTVPAGFDADDFWRRLQARYATVPTLTIPAALQRPPSRYEREGTISTTT